MKVFVAIAALLISVAPNGCAKDEEESEVSTLADDTGYTAGDIRMRKAFEDWTAFCRDADNIVMDARIQISQATDCSPKNDP
jgi:hypothetical protein